MPVAMTNEPARSQAEWVERCRAGDLQAWRWLYGRHFEGVHRLVLRLGVPEREAPDVCQEIFFRAYRALATFRGEAQFSTWLYRIAVNEARRSGRLRGLRQALLALYGRETAGAAAVSPADAGPEASFARAEAWRELAGLLSRMKPKHREAFVLYELEELPLEAVAAALGCALETAKSRLKRARAEFERLRRQRTLVALAGGKRS
jgi:RNA polymerase sigma-70 factor, ECF subfamily